MTRPEIIRADSIDLQDREAPSAKDHPRPNKPTSNGSLAPHQAETLREVAAETAEEHLRSPRVSWTSGEVGDLQQYAEDLGAGITNSLSTLSNEPSTDNPAASEMSATQQQDALAIAQNGGLSGQEADDADLDADADDGMDDDMMDKISSSPSIEDEDIDFEFVYALHTFVATVEGQANATKGDTMVLLDDSNSYWWLVRVVKDSSIGYLPAEHIETPTERLARLNKHRNIDLSATMLGDQADKPRNPIKTAIKRRKTKTVTFTSPTYVDYSDFDYSTDEEDMEAEYFDKQDPQAQQTATQQANSGAEADDETAKVEPLKPRSQQNEPAKAASQMQEPNGEAAASAMAARRTSEEFFETKSGDGPKKASDGTVRDSFFKDDTVETKKITLTPNLLRDDNAPRASTDSKEVKQRPSLDKLDKESLLGKEDKKKKDKKEKDKKPSAIRNFFSRKGKKEADGTDDDSLGKRSMEASFDSQDRDAEEDEAVQSSPEKAAGVQRNPSKLQKQQPRTEPSPTRKSNLAQRGESGGGLRPFSPEGRVNNVANVPPASMRIVDPDPQESPESSPQKTSRDRAPKDEKSSTVSKIIGLRSHGEPRPPKVTKAKSRSDLDDFDTADEDSLVDSAQQASAPAENGKQQQRPTLPGAYPDSYDTSQSVSSAQTERGPPNQDSELSPLNSNNPPPLMVDTSSQEEDQSSSRSTPELLEHEDGDMHGKQDSITTSTSTTTSTTWNDTSLREFFDSGSDIRDLLVVVYDKTDVAPAGPEHPVAGSLFREQNAKLAEITTQLDNMLGDWLARKQRLRGTV